MIGARPAAGVGSFPRRGTVPHPLGVNDHPVVQPAASQARSLREAQFDLLRRSRHAIAGLGLLWSLLLALVASGSTAGPLAVIAPFALFVLHGGFHRQAGLQRASPRAATCWGAAIGIGWSGLVLLLLPRLGAEPRVAVAVICVGLLGSLVLAASVLPVAIALALPVACVAVVSLLSLHLARLLDLLLLGPPASIAVILCANRVLTQQLRRDLAQQHRRDVAAVQLRDLQETAHGWLWECDSEGRLTELTREVAERVGLTPDSLSGVLVCNLIDAQRDTEARAPLLQAAFQRREPLRECVVPIEINGRTRWISIAGTPRTDEAGNFAGYAGTGIDMTEQRENESRLAFLALNDGLTGLPNRASFDRRVDDACRAARTVALMSVSLDDFAAINNTLGAAAGDQLLVAFAARLRTVVRAADCVGRLGGGEFGILVDCLDRDLVTDIAARIVADASAPYRLIDVDADVASGVSVGLAFAPADATEGTSLGRNASLALARARRDGLGRPRAFEPAMLVEQQDQRALLSDLRQALGRRELALCYHPIVDLSTGDVVSAEALLRWNHPTRGMIAPATFIPIAEQSGLIIAIGRFAMIEACRHAATWREPVRVAVNVSPAQFRDEALLQSIDAALAGAGLPPTRLEIEITESVLLEASRSTLGVLRGLRERGIRVALDDFGTGYSSLRYLRSFPFDKVKIDASFVRDMASDAEAAAIVRAVIGLASSFGMKTTAEGVETEAQREGLRADGCDEGQGYLFSRVRNPASMLEFVGARQQPGLC